MNTQLKEYDRKLNDTTKESEYYQNEYQNYKNKHLNLESLKHQLEIKLKEFECKCEA